MNMRKLLFIITLTFVFISSCEKKGWNDFKLHKSYYFDGATKVKGWCNNTHIILKYLKDGDPAYGLDTIVDGTGEMIFDFKKTAVEARLLLVDSTALDPEYELMYKEL